VWHQEALEIGEADDRTVEVAIEERFLMDPQQLDEVVVRF
jgi:hypothetical protein